MLTSFQHMFDLNNDANVSWWEWPASIVVWWCALCAVTVVAMLVLATSINTADRIFRGLEAVAHFVFRREPIRHDLATSPGFELSHEDLVEAKRRGVVHR